MSNSRNEGTSSGTQGIPATADETTVSKQLIPAEMAEKMDDVDCRVPMAQNPVRVPERIAALIRTRTAAKGRR